MQEDEKADSSSFFSYEKGCRGMFERLYEAGFPFMRTYLSNIKLGMS